jgi:hypothetical protein
VRKKGKEEENQAGKKLIPFGVVAPQQLPFFLFSLVLLLGLFFAHSPVW